MLECLSKVDRQRNMILPKKYFLFCFNSWVWRPNVSMYWSCLMFCLSRFHPDHLVGCSGDFGDRRAAVSGEIAVVFPAEPLRDVEARTRAQEDQRSGSQPPQAVFISPNPRTYSPAHTAHRTCWRNHTATILTFDLWLEVSSLLVLPLQNTAAQACGDL